MRYYSMPHPKLLRKWPSSTENSPKDPLSAFSSNPSRVTIHHQTIPNVSLSSPGGSAPQKWTRLQNCDYQPCCQQPCCRPTFQTCMSSRYPSQILRQGHPYVLAASIIPEPEGPSYSCSLFHRRG